MLADISESFSNGLWWQYAAVALLVLACGLRAGRVLTHKLRGMVRAGASSGSGGSGAGACGGCSGCSTPCASQVTPQQRNTGALALHFHPRRSAS